MTLSLQSISVFLPDKKKLFLPSRKVATLQEREKKKEPLFQVVTTTIERTLSAHRGQNRLLPYSALTKLNSDNAALFITKKEGEREGKTVRKVRLVPSGS